MATLFAYLSYRDAPTAIAWLHAVGFETTTRQDDAAGGVQHAELKLGDAVVMVAGMDADYVIAPLRGQSTGAGLYLAVEDVPAVHAAALAGGAQEVYPPETTEWGTVRSRVLDPEGYEWSFGTYVPGGTW